jgi:hypothetical protein
MWIPVVATSHAAKSYFLAIGYKAILFSATDRNRRVPVGSSQSQGELWKVREICDERYPPYDIRKDPGNVPREKTGVVMNLLHLTDLLA